MRVAANFFAVSGTVSLLQELRKILVVPQTIRNADSASSAADRLHWTSQSENPPHGRTARSRTEDAVESEANRRLSIGHSLEAPAATVFLENEKAISFA